MFILKVNMPQLLTTTHKLLRNMRIILCLTILLALFGCKTKNKTFEKLFSSCLNEEQVQTVLDINHTYDDFILKKFPASNGNLDIAYGLLSNSIAITGDFDNYFLSKSELDLIQKELISSGLFDDIFLNDEFIYNYQSRYMKCIEKISITDRNIKEIYNTKSASGDLYSMSLAIGAFSYISKNKLSKSAGKSIIVFEFVLGQMIKQK